MLKDFAQWASPMRDEIRDCAEELAEQNGVEIEFVRKSKTFRKDERVKEIVAARGTEPGLVHIFSAMESCTAFKPWHDKRTHKNFFRYDTGRCLHYYFYFIDPEFGRVLRIETFSNDITFFRHHRRVEHRDGSYTYKSAGMRKTIYSLADLAEVMRGCNRRYIEFLSRVDDPSNELKKVNRISGRVQENGGSFRGFNLFDADDEAVLRVIAQGGYQAFGIRNRDLRRALGKSVSQVSLILKRLRNHGILKKVSKSYKYY